MAGSFTFIGARLPPSVAHNLYTLSNIYFRTSCPSKGCHCAKVAHSFYFYFYFFVFLFPDHSFFPWYSFVPVCSRLFPFVSLSPSPLALSAFAASVSVVAVFSLGPSPFPCHVVLSQAHSTLTHSLRSSRFYSSLFVLSVVSFRPSGNWFHASNELSKWALHDGECVYITWYLKLPLMSVPPIPSPRARLSTLRCSPPGSASVGRFRLSSTSGLPQFGGSRRISSTRRVIPQHVPVRDGSDCTESGCFDSTGGDVSSNDWNFWVMTMRMLCRLGTGAVASRLSWWSLRFVMSHRDTRVSLPSVVKRAWPPDRCGRIWASCRLWGESKWSWRWAWPFGYSSCVGPRWNQDTKRDSA